MNILVTPDQFLRLKAKPVVKYDKKLAQQIAEMTKTLQSAQDPEGVGLAATQVGIDKRLFLVTLNGRVEVFINPKLTFQSDALFSDVHRKSKDRWLEGCLSIPGVWGFVDRPFSIEIDYHTPLNGELVPRHRKFEDLESAYVQHENDHLDGILFTDHILKQGGQIFRETSDGLVPIDNI